MGHGARPGSTGPSITVVLGDDVAELRELLRWEIEEEGDMTVVGEAGDGRQVLEVLADKRPDVVLLDLSMPEMDGLEVLEEMRRRALPVRVVVLSGYTQQSMGARAREQGADEYVEKGAPGSVIRDAVRSAARAALA
ncbi:MAG: hypothetical protein QOG62_1313 [Thermoleophilaceae bacterium]|jgi:DNA-binding NarL/FixJ family response regulator|nr:hypothetical protein [Thermoleophilaceae bacterium]